MKNPQRKIVNIWKVLTAIFLLGAFMPYILNLDMMDIGFGIVFISGFFALMGLIVIFVYNKRANLLDKLLNGENLLAHWHYSPEEWALYSDYDFEERKKTAKGIFYLISGISMLVGIIFSFVVENAIPFFICCGIVAIVAIPAFLVPRFAHSRNEKQVGEVLLSNEAVFINGEFHNWNMMNSRLEIIVLDETVQPFIIKLTYSYPTKNGRSQTEVRIPVPRGEEKKARSIVEEMSRKN